MPIEISILGTGLEIKAHSLQGFHGFMISKKIKDRDGARLLTAHGTLYKALSRMEKAGLLESDWEDPLIAAEEGRPRRRLYNVTSAGKLALAKAQTAAKLADGIKGGLATA